MQQFFNSDEQMFCPFPPQGLCSPSSQGGSSSNQSGLPPEKKHYEKQTTTHRLHGLGLAFRNSWRRKEPEHKPVKKSSSSVIILYDQGFIFISWLKGCLDLLSFLLQYATIEVCSAKFAAKIHFHSKGCLRTRTAYFSDFFSSTWAFTREETDVSGNFLIVNLN